MKTHARLHALVLAMALVSACYPEPEYNINRNRPTDPNTLTVGTTLTYTRSNQDGTKPERIRVHIVSPTEVHVIKTVAPCTDAAYVTAVFDPAMGEATRLVGGRLGRDGQQEPQAFLTLTSERRLELRVGDPAGPVAETLIAPSAPWRMYDFDLAEFALFGPREPKDFTFGLAMAWPDGSTPFVRTLGEANAMLTVQPHREDNANVFTLSGPAFGDGGGTLITDARFGYVRSATISTPNHPGYADFKLVLDNFNVDAGLIVWESALENHWKRCPAPTDPAGG